MAKYWEINLKLNKGALFSEKKIVQAGGVEPSALESRIVHLKGLQLLKASIGKVMDV